MCAGIECPEIWTHIRSCGGDAHDVLDPSIQRNDVEVGLLGESCRSIVGGDKDFGNFILAEQVASDVWPVLLKDGDVGQGG